MNNKKFVATLSATALALSVASCSLDPDYHRPAMPVSQSWQNGGGASNVAAYDWRQFYRQPGMQKVIGLALNNNRDLRIAALRVQEAQAQFRISRSALMPTIEAGASETSQRLPGGLYNTRDSGAVTYHQYEAGVGITSWEIDFFGRIRSLNERALQTYLATAAMEQATRITLISEIAAAYLSLATDKDKLKLAQQTAESQRASLKLVQYRVETGTDNDQARAQAELSVADAEADVQRFSRQLEEDINALTFLTGTAVPPDVIAEATLKKDYQFPDLRAGLPSDLLTRRPDIIAAEHNLKAANANIGAARAAFFPSISLTADAGTMSGSLGNLFEGGTATWSFIPSINIPIFTGGRNMANLDSAHLQKREEIAQYERSIQQAFREVADALAGKNTWHQEVAARSRSNAANERYYKLSQYRYQGGIDGYLNVLVAQRSNYQSEKDLLDARAGELNQNVTLYKVLGGGW